ncbi:hypothetical protein QBC46DRAFT_347261 [Diplogelasinospora grovesii]|uniref:Fumarylacetoacetate hydrolase n=1 Tax=Diplogelasinospora grovesii TaxID=303347 RepID=A0AAN6S027_9PEZI|nr:hypothetical protein QBC46DRAFT_347261 [Diplogelasinospora grovesii]
MTATSGTNPNGANTLTNYAAYLDPTTQTPRIGHLDLSKSEIQPLSFASGTPLTTLYQVIAAGESNIAPSRNTTPIPVSSLKLLPPISGRDILAVGKNYVEHAKEFHSSGFDSSDTSSQPTHPVIFTKRATSIIAHGDPILLHAEWTQTADYEGEIGVIIGKPGFRISPEAAMSHVWGYTIINDMTAREKQRDHKQFFLGKSPDTFCPMGPVAVPKERLPADLTVTTHVNGEKRQEASLAELIFSVPKLIETISAAQTVQAGDVIATGTPFGVGFGFRPMRFLQAGDEVEISVTGLGTLRNKIAGAGAKNTTTTTTIERLESHVPVANVKVPAGTTTGLTTLESGKKLFYQNVGRRDGAPVIFIHGLGGSSTYFTPLVARMEETHSLHLIDLEGHGLSPTSALSRLSIESFADDIFDLAKKAPVTQGATVVAHSMGCLVALKLALTHPELVSSLVLMGPPPNPLPEAASQGTYARAATVREKGMLSVVEAIVKAATSAQTQSENPLGVAAVRLSLLGQDPEGYAKACMALAGSVSDSMDVKQLRCQTLIVTGDQDKVSPPAVCEKYAGEIAGAKVKVLENVGHWHLFEDVKGCVDAVN